MDNPKSRDMDRSGWHIYLGEIPYSQKGDFWVSFESDPGLKKTKANIYGRCLPCIQNLYEQLKAGVTKIRLDSAYHCWKVTAILNGIEDCLSLLHEFEKRFPGGHVYGKLGSGRPKSTSKVVVFHTEDETERDRIRDCLMGCLPAITENPEIKISRACAVLYEDILGDWRAWTPVSTIKHPERVDALLARIKKILYRAVM
jgi:hypothetical protein